MVFCICGNLEVMRFSRGFSQMRQQRRASREPSVRHPIRSVLAGGLSCCHSVIRHAAAAAIRKTVNLIRFLRPFSDITVFPMTSSLT